VRRRSPTISLAVLLRAASIQNVRIWTAPDFEGPLSEVVRAQQDVLIDVHFYFVALRNVYRYRSAGGVTSACSLRMLFRDLREALGDQHPSPLVRHVGETFVGIRLSEQNKSWQYLCDELAHAVRCRSAVLDGEIACLEPDGRSHFYNLMFRREWPFFLAFDVLWLDGNDLRNLPLHRRKRILAGLMPRVESQVRLVEHVKGRGVDFFRAACAHDLEGVVAKWQGGTYQSGAKTSWLKFRNPKYSQWNGRRDLFDARGDNARRRAHWVKPELALL
jgi:hypothetical protein